jgi:hypothetical protein
MEQRSNSGLFSAIVSAWLIVGTLDILAAMIQTAMAGGNQVRLFQYIASGVFGPSAFEGGTGIALLGLLFHYFIALTWTVLFFLAYPRLRFAQQYRVLTGIGYGCVVWFVMNRVVLPMSNVPQRPFDIAKSLIAAAVLIVAIGLPLSFLAKRFFAKRR